MARLTDAQKKKLPQELRTILLRFEHEPRLLMQLKQLFSSAADKIARHSIEHNSFCDTFPTPKLMPRELLKLYGLTENQLNAPMEKIGWYKHARYKDVYYRTMAIAYLIGLNFDDINIRKLAIFFTAIRIWNGRKMVYFKKYCDPDIAKYVVNYELRSHHTLVVGGRSPFSFLDSYNVPAFEKTYGGPGKIPDNLDSFTEGLRKIPEAEFNKINQLFKSMAQAYYKVHKEGKKEITADKYHNQYGQGDLAETKESFSGNIERLVDKIEKNAMIRRNLLLKPEAQKILKDKFNISTQGIKRVQDWIENDENQDELRYFYELVFTTLKPNSEADICKYGVDSLAKAVSSAKKDKNLLKAKEILDHILLGIFGDAYNTMGMQSKYQRKFIVAYSLSIYAKLMLCKTL